MRSLLADHNAVKGKSPTSSILKVAGSAFPSLWTGLSEALSVVEGDVGGTEPDRFGALLRGYLAYLHLADDSEEHYKGKAHCCCARPRTCSGVVFALFVCVLVLFGLCFRVFSSSTTTPPPRTRRTAPWSVIVGRVCVCFLS